MAGSVAVELPAAVSAAGGSGSAGAAAPPKSPPKLKNDKGKLTELHGEPPVTIKRNENGYLNRGRMLGEGGFARVYAATDSLNGAAKAVKVISKEQLKSSKTKGKLFAEIKLHQVMDHANIIKFECCFEDSSCVYMQLELCAHGSMLDLLRRRKRFTEPETRYYLTQLVGAAQYMHTNSVIHRDLKLGNLMLDADMNLKVGDFGLAALVKFPGERKKTICGTPNYIAPEILFDQNTGHSFEADIWSIGVVVYTMIVGKPPFQTKELKAIYKKIKQLEYSFPSNVDISDAAIDLIEAILDRDPQSRPSADEILCHEFQYDGPFPRSIPRTAMDVAPDFSAISVNQSARNYQHVQKASGASLVPLTAATGTIHEGEEGATGALPEPPAQVVALSNGSNLVAQEMAIEREVKKVLEPGSPISELLKSARKPLMVSPRALAAQREREKNEIARKATVNASMSASSRLDRLAEKENAAPSEQQQQHQCNGAPRRVTRSQAQEKKDGKEDAGETGLENAVRALRVTSGAVTSPSRMKSSSTVAGGLAAGNRQDSKRRLATTSVSSAASAIVVAKENETEARAINSAGEVYEACLRMLEGTIGSARGSIQLQEPEHTPPPKVFITAWIDYTHKYGTAYQLTDGSAGVYFNDSTSMILAPGRQYFDYISSRKGNVYQSRNHDIQSFPKDLDRKVYLMTYFEEYMSKTLERDVDWVFSDKEKAKNMVFLVKYQRMKNAIVFKLSNDVLQFNFFDHTKILLTEGATVVTFIGPDYKLKCYHLGKLLRRAERLNLFGAEPQLTSKDPTKQKTIDSIVLLFSKLEYCREVLKGLCEKKRPSASGAPVA